jgi:extracellular factor (EF) 3-hydroxypalmitic acid methyl ester biosynthesis protein
MDAVLKAVDENETATAIEQGPAAGSLPGGVRSASGVVPAGTSRTANSLAEELSAATSPSSVPPHADSQWPHEPWGQVGNYAERDAATGRDIFFRPDRYQLADLGPVGVDVQLELNGKVQSCELFDISQNGVAFEWPIAPMPELGTLLRNLAVRFDEHEAYRGQVCVSSIRQDQGRSIVGVSFFDTLMNIEDVLHLRDIKAWSGGAQETQLGLSQAPWRVEGHERFKSQVADLRLLLLDACDALTDLEASLPWHLAHGQTDSPARRALIQRIYDEFVVDTVRLSDQIDRGLRSASVTERYALREFSLRSLDDLFMRAPSAHRARRKPLGYPGDYEVMNDIYSRHFQGPTLFAKAMNLAFISTAAARAVRARKDLIKQQLSRLLDRPNPPSPLRILSIAAGPAQEIYELLRDREDLPVPVEVVLFDQDKGALAFSYRRLKRVIAEKWGNRVKLVHLHDSIKRLLRGATVFGGSQRFDAVYSCGLFDYLQPLTVVSLFKGLYATVAPGGTLYVGNMAPSCPSRWFMEIHLEWFLNYREREEMLGLAHRAAPDAHLDLLEEATGYNPFVAMTRMP